MSDLPQYLKRLQAESIYVIRETAAECRKPVFLYSVGKDSSVVLRLMQKAFFPGRLPFPLLHIDTGWDFREIIAHRDGIVRELGLELTVHTNPDGVAANINPLDHTPSHYTQVMKLDALDQMLTAHGFDAVFGGARRDDEQIRATEPVFGIRTAPRSGQNLRVFPLSNWTEADVWTYIMAEDIPIVPLYYAASREVVERDGSLIAVHDERMRLRPGEVPQARMVRFRSLGCYPLTAAMESTATTLPEIVAETLAAQKNERSGRVIA